MADSTPPQPPAHRRNKGRSPRFGATRHAAESIPSRNTSASPGSPLLALWALVTGPIAGVVGAAFRLRINGLAHLTVCVSDGRALWAARYASDGKAPTLFHGKGLDDIGHLHLEIVQRPIGRIAEVWAPVP